MFDFLDGEDGSFLVRASSSSPGDYVLTVRKEEEVLHYQIRKHKEDAFFSIGILFVILLSLLASQFL